MQVEEPYIGNLNGYLKAHPTNSPECTVKNVRVGVWQYIEKERIYTMHNKFSNYFIWVSQSTSDLTFYFPV